MEKFTLINKDRSRIKVFEPFEEESKPSPSIVFALFLKESFIFEYLFLDQMTSI